MISRCSEARERTMNRSEWSSETTTDDTNGGYRRTPVTSIDATRTTRFWVAGPVMQMRVQIDAEGGNDHRANSDC